jgi:hypothetical protein
MHQAVLLNSYPEILYPSITTCLSILKWWKRIHACCSIGAVCTNSFLDHVASRRWIIFKRPGRLCPDKEVPGGHSQTANWSIHFRQLKGNTFQSTNLSTNIDLGGRKKITITKITSKNCSWWCCHAYII